MEENKILKQEYLKKEILNKNYSAEKFTEFLIKEKPNGDNIDNWNIEELYTIVQIYKKLNKINDKDYLDFQLQEIELSNNETFSKRIKCKIFKDTIFKNNKEKYKVKITSVNIEKGGFFSKNKYIISISLPKLKINMNKEINEIFWLHNTLKNEFPISYIPPLNLSSQNDFKIEQKFKDYWKIKIQNFLNKIINNKNLNNSKALEIFFMSQTINEYEKKKEIYSNNLKKQTENFKINNINFDYFKENLADKNIFDYISSKNGYIDISMNNYINYYYKILKNKFSVYRNEYNDLLNKTENIIDNMNNLKASIEDFSKSISNLNINTHTKTNNYKYYNINLNIEENIIKNLENSLKNYSFFIKEQMDIFKAHFYDFFHNRNFEINSIKHLCKVRNEFAMDLFNTKSKLNDKKDIFLSNLTNKIEISYYKDKLKTLGVNNDNKPLYDKVIKKVLLEKDTKIVQNFNKFYCYVNYHIYKECDYFFENFTTDFIKNLKKFAINNNDILEQQKQVFNELNKNLNENIKIIKTN